MPMTTQPGEQSNIILIDASEPLTLKDFEDSFAIQTEIMNKATEKVHLFVTVHRLRNMPNGVLRVREKAPIFSHRNAGYMLIISASAVIRAIAGMICRLAGYNMIRFFDSEAHAWDFLKQHGVSQS